MLGSNNVNQDPSLNLGATLNHQTNRQFGLEEQSNRRRPLDAMGGATHIGAVVDEMQANKVTRLNYVTVYSYMKRYRYNVLHWSLAQGLALTFGKAQLGSNLSKYNKELE